MKVAIAQINPTLGAFEQNAEKIIDYCRRAKDKRAELVVFSEMTVMGYPANDLLDFPYVTKEQTKYVNKILRSIPKDITVIFGAVVENKKVGKPYFNCAVIARKGKKPQYIAKQLLPSYDVFDETRYFEPGTPSKLVKIPKIGNVAVTICEDMWHEQYSVNPISHLKKADLVVNLSASPFALGKHNRRKSVVQKHVKKIKAPFVFVNQVGGQDEIVFDGRSFVTNKNGKIIVQAIQWHEDLVMVDFKENLTEHRPVETSRTEHIRLAIITGIRDFLKKVGLKKVHLGISGGIDSAVVAALAADAVGPHNVTGFILPGPYSSEGSWVDAQKLADNLGISSQKVSIKELYELAKKTGADFGLSQDSEDLAHQNIQARLRGIILMTFANMESSLLLATGNKSEMAAGYCTLYGDMCGGLAPIGDLVKSDVYDLAHLYNTDRELVPKSIIEKPPSAELAPDQKDEDSLPPYKDLDASVVKIVEKRKTPTTPTDKWLIKQIRQTEFKRWQAPPIIRVTERAFGRGRRIPIAKFKDIFVDTTW